MTWSSEYEEKIKLICQAAEDASGMTFKMFEFCGDPDIDGFLRGLTLLVVLTGNLLENTPEGLTDEQVDDLWDLICDVTDQMPWRRSGYAVN